MTPVSLPSRLRTWRAGRASQSPAPGGTGCLTSSRARADSGGRWWSPHLWGKEAHSELVNRSAHGGKHVVGDARTKRADRPPDGRHRSHPHQNTRDIDA